MTATIEITDGTQTIDLTDGTNYGVLSWSPRLSHNPTGRVDGYQDVQEEMTIWIEGTSSTDFLDKVNDLTDLLDQAVRWSRGQNVDAVTIDYTPSSGGTEYSAAIVGVPQDVLAWPATFGLSAAATFKVEATLRFTRRGAWLASEDNQSDTGHAIGATVHTVSFASSAPIASPLRARWGGNVSTFASGDIPRGFIIFGGGDLLAVEAEDVGGTGITSVDESANFASSGFVQQSTGASGTIEFIHATGHITDAIRDASRVAVFIVAKCSSGAEFEINIAGYGTGTVGVEPVRSREVAFSETIPTAIALGSIPNPNLYFGRIHIEFARLSASGTLDIDYVVFADADHPAFSSILFTADATWGSGGGDGWLEIDHKLLERTNAQVFRRGGLVSNPPQTQPHRGSAYLPTFGTDVNYVLALVGGEDEDHWRYGTTLAADSWDVNFWRRLAHLVPR